MKDIITIKGKYNNAIVYQSALPLEAYDQILSITNQKFTEGESIRIMPDVHSGKGAVIGYTQTFNNRKIVPGMVGVDIACGVRVVELGKIKIDFEALDKFIHENIPAGHNIHEYPIRPFDWFKDLSCWDSIKDGEERFRNATGSLGGGNHFIEIDRDDEDNLYLVIHTGSRNLGKMVADYHRRKAIEYHRKNDWGKVAEKIIKEAKAEGKERDISSRLAAAKETVEYTPEEFAYLEDSKDVDDYLNDTKICTLYSTVNRYTIAVEICKFLGLTDCNILKNPTFETLHNYIDLEHGYIRKGAVSAQKGERLIVPINMRDGSLICIGKGNPEYNYSAPHGAGRLFSRSAAKREIALEDFEKSMEGIYTTCVNESTLDESCFAYRDINAILPFIEDTCEIERRIYPVYNFKASE